MLRQSSEDNDSDMTDANRLKPEFARSCILQLYFVYMTTDKDMILLPDTQTCKFRMRREFRERFPRHRELAIPAYITARDGRRDSYLAFFLSRWRGKHSRHSLCLRNPQFTYLVRGP